MPHFMVRRKQLNANPQSFQNVSQTGKRFFYHLDNQGFPVDDNTVINYEINLQLSHIAFRQLIRDVTGQHNPIAKTTKFNYHLDKNSGLIDVNYCINTLGLPNNINGYNLTKIGIAANYTKDQAKGNILFIFCDQNNQNNEVCISVHIRHSKENTNYINTLVPLLNNAVNSLNPQNNPFWQLKPWDNFSNSLNNSNPASNYIVTGNGYQEEINYKNAYNAYTAHLFINEFSANFQFP